MEIISSNQQEIQGRKTSLTCRWTLPLISRKELLQFPIEWSWTSYKENQVEHSLLINSKLMEQLGIYRFIECSPYNNNNLKTCF